MPMSPPAISYRARWVFPITEPPIAHGVVTLDSTTGEVLAFAERVEGERAIDLGNVAVLPGLVNAHTHLEFSDLARPLGDPGIQFPAWIRRVIEHRRNDAAVEDFAQRRINAVRQGLEESRRAGVAAIGEIATPGFPTEVFENESLLTTIFLELLGLSPDREAALLELAEAHLTAARSAGQPTSIVHGLSPHAPYTASPELVQAACALSKRFAAPLAMHLAESFDEIELLQAHSGGLVELLSDLGAWHPGAIPRGIEPRQYLEWLAQAHRALVIHGNFLQPDDWQFLAERRDTMALVHCPRTHAFFGRGTFPLRELLDAGVRVALGTDSRASNPDLNLLAEMQQVFQEHPDVSGEEILKLGTIEGAKSLGIDAKRCFQRAVLVEQQDGTLEDPYEFLFCASRLREWNSR
jgi:cytosine/adenosine deaminase-related metal-dependent hydrolase